MTDHDQFLWDRRGDVDATLARLEELLRPLAHDGRDLPLADLPAQVQRTTRLPRARWLLGAAAAAALVVGALLWPRERPLAPGAPPRDFAATTAPLRIGLGTLAELELAPGSALRFEHWRDDQALFRLQRGELRARVAPPPAVAAGFFQVDTPRGRVVDQGCQYLLQVDDDGHARVQVVEGAVTFEFPQRTVFVPAGAAVSVAARGPGTPLFDDCSPELRKAARAYDQSLADGDLPRREQAADALAASCTDRRDSLALWHLLRDPEPLLRERAEAALVQLVGPPEEPSKGSFDTWDAEIWIARLRLRDWLPTK